MLRPIPQSLLGDLAIIKVCTGMDAWQKPVWQDYEVSRVHLQNTNEVKKTKENTEVVLRSTLFIDASLSRPALDYDSLAEHSPVSYTHLSRNDGITGYSRISLPP